MIILPIKIYKSYKKAVFVYKYFDKQP